MDQPSSLSYTLEIPSATCHTPIRPAHFASDASIEQCTVASTMRTADHRNPANIGPGLAASRGAHVSQGAYRTAQPPDLLSLQLFDKYDKYRIHRRLGSSLYGVMGLASVLTLKWLEFGVHWVSPRRKSSVNPASPCTAQADRGMGEHRRRVTEVLPPRLSKKFTTFEYSVHECPRGLGRDIAPVFPGVDLGGLLLIPTLQKAAVALDSYGDPQELEKNRLQSVFFEWVALLKAQLDRTGHWLDATDPATGAALYGRPAALYSDVPPMARLLRYRTLDCGGCTILLHPQWRSSVYPATVFTTAPFDVVVNALKAVNEDDFVLPSCSLPQQNYTQTATS